MAFTIAKAGGTVPGPEERLRFGEDVAGPEDQVTVLRKKKARFRTVLVIGSEFADTEEKKMPEKKITKMGLAEGPGNRFGYSSRASYLHNRFG